MGIRKVRAGESVKPHISAEWYNSTIRDQGGAPPSPIVDPNAAINTSLVWLQNDTGARR